MVSSIPDQWLTPSKLGNGLKFQCSTDLRGLIITDRAAVFFRQLVTLIERDYNLVNFHLKIQHNHKKSDQLEVYVFFGDNQIQQEAEPVLICSSCDINHELSQATLLYEQNCTYAWLDFRNRPKLILTPKRHIERLSELRDENGEIEAFWRDVLRVIDRECSNATEFKYPVLAFNHGTLRKHAHLHLKIDVTKDIWEKNIVSRYKEKILHLQHILKHTQLISACFTEKHLHQEIEKGVIGCTNSKIKRDEI